MRTVPSPSVPWVEEGTKLPFSDKVQAGSSGFAVVESPEPSFRSRLVRSKRTQRAALAAAAFILSGVALLFICKRLSNNSTVAGLPHRRLAGNYDREGTSDEELDAILDQCLELEAEHGEPLSKTDSAEPAAKKAKLVAFLEEAASSHKFAELDSTLIEGGSPISRSWRQAQELEWPNVVNASGLQSAGEVLTQWTPSANPAGPEDVSLPGLDIDPDLNPEAFLEQIPHLEEEGEGEGREPVGPSVLHGGEDQEKPSISRTLTELLSSTSSLGPRRLGLDRHPFYRLPDILPGAVKRPFHLVRVYTKGYSGATFFPMVEKMRELFLRSFLGPREVEELMCAAESLVCYIRNHPSKGAASIFSPSHAIRYLGSYFFVLDYLLCARQLVGTDTISDQFWHDLTRSIDTRIFFAKANRHASAREKHNYALVMRLIPAVDLMKTGVRPDVEDIVGLKRMLLCSRFSDPKYKAPRWDPWRGDDAQYARIHEDHPDNPKDERN